MNNRYLPIFGFILFCLSIVQNGYSQNCVIDVTYKVTNASPGRADGGILFQFTGAASNDDRYVILNLTASRKEEREDKIKLPGHEVKDLAKGYYEFSVIDRKKACSKEIGIEIKESENK